MPLNASQGQAINFQGINRNMMYAQRGSGRGQTAGLGLLQEEDKQKEPIQTSGFDNTDQALGDAANTSANASAGKTPQNASWFDDAQWDAKDTPPSPGFVNNTPAPNFDDTTPITLTGPTSNPTMPNFDDSDATTVPHDSMWFERTARQSLTQLAKQLQTPDDGAPSQDVPTTSHIAADGDKLGYDFHPDKAKQAQDAARGARPDFTDYDRISQQVKDEAAKQVNGEGLGAGLLRAFVPGANSFLPQQGAKLNALLVQQKIAYNQAVQQNMRDHPESYQKPAQDYTLSPGQSRYSGTQELAHNDKPDPASTKAPNFSMHADPVTGDVSGYDPTSNTLNPTMSPVFDEQGPSINGTPGYTGQKQANLGVKEPVEKNLQIKETQNDDGTVSSRVYDAQGNVVKQNQFKGAGKTKTVAPSTDDKNLESDRREARNLYQAWASKNPNASPAAIAKQKKALDPDGKLLATPVTGKLSNGSTFGWTP